MTAAERPTPEGGPGAAAPEAPLYVDLDAAIRETPVAEALAQLEDDLIGLRPVKERVREIALNVWRTKQSVEAGPRREWRPIFRDIGSRLEFEPYVMQLLSELVEKGLKLNLDFAHAGESLAPA